MGIATRLDEDPSGTCIDQSMYRGIIGSLLYLTASRPDISFSVGLCARFQANPKESHLTAVKRILRYLKGTDDLSLFYPRSDSFDLNSFTDADYAGDLVNRKSTSETSFKINCIWKVQFLKDSSSNLKFEKSIEFVQLMTEQ
ncbi:uncharacterized protein LOC110724084 [Chenopodium quinoa]|uniref:uncharacterized protein LOC110724084 n=1 Tax=Chenopodium quinoa TaxID=63459 RepID=UPI000B78F88E|nr:uncharacterized protein LOC110724084 [Chenopodium quinoa]